MTERVQQPPPTTHSDESASSRSTPAVESAGTTLRTQQRFTQEEAAEIIREATEVSLRGGGAELTRAELSQMASELGVDEASLDRALERRAQKKQREKQVRAQLLGAASHVGTYLAGISGLFVIDLVTGPGWWVQWPAMGWGLGVGIHLIKTFKRSLMANDSSGSSADRP